MISVKKLNFSLLGWLNTFYSVKHQPREGGLKVYSLLENIKKLYITI